ncbi:MAG: lamin tail domain-containing protein [bacterium]|nr:lamin tail domain-containing protein [bacterium]
MKTKKIVTKKKKTPRPLRIPQDKKARGKTRARPRARVKPRVVRKRVVRKTTLSVRKARPNALVKFLAVILMVGLNSAGLSSLGYTMGYYNDVETSTGNTFSAGEVDFSLGVSGWQATSTAISMPPGDITKKEITIDPQDSNPFQYFATSTNFIGDADFCSGLNVTAKLEGDTMYNGPLTGLKTATTTTLDSWEFTYTTGVNNFQNKVCDFDIDYNGWQTRHNYPTYENGGYSDTEKVPNHLASWGFRINKVYYDVKVPERGVEGTNEWVEIYNQTNVPLDISGWEICDNNSCDTLPTTPLIPAQKYAVIVATSTTATTTTVSSGLPAYWYLPSEVTQINLGQKIGDGLANGADMLVLKRPDGAIVDQMNWGTPVTSWANYNANVWNPGATDVAEGNVLARVPSGYDTDTPSDWQELKPPSVDLVYPDEGGSYTWYWTYSYNIEWSAINNNGANEDLDISIFYVKDVNHNGVIDVPDTTHTIAATTANDGLFNWAVPSGFLGYIWIHLVATGPENPMLNSGTVSGRIYDPFPIFIGPENVVAPASSALATDGQGIAIDETPVVPDENIVESVVEPTEEPAVVESAPEDIEIVASEPQPSPEATAGETEVVVVEEVIPSDETAVIVEEETEVVTEIATEVISEVPPEPVVTEEPSVIPEELPAVVESAPTPEPEPQPSPEATAGTAEPV